MDLTFQIQGGDFTSAGTASSEVRRTLKELGVDASVIKRVVVALYEAEVNIVAHAYKGEIMAQISPEQVFLRLTDQGPGIPDIEKAMTPGYSTASQEVREMGFGAGMGLPNICRNADVFNIHSVPDKGTTVEITIQIN
ncbi:MAG: ATP-binding protein [Bacteroidales bacterium]|nr:ATP-binding protein [Bacteroidales bacterium]HHV41075.1 anti-sigma regulatory factor [Bacteroidales bacterium]